MHLMQIVALCGIRIFTNKAFVNFILFSDPLG